MSHSRRSFLSSVGLGGAAVMVPAFGLRAMEPLTHGCASDPIFTADHLRLDRNENPYGPAKAAVDAITAAFTDASRYPDEYESKLREGIAAFHGVSVEHVLLGSGSGEVLRMATEAFTSGSRHLVSASPTFEQPANTAKRIGARVAAPAVDSSLKLDLDAMAAAAPGAGLVFICNPNNPTGTLHPASAITDFIKRVRSSSPDTYIMIDEAYLHYVEDPAYASALPAALDDSHVMICRTFSKIFGLAGMRVGYAIAKPETVARMSPFRLAASVGVLTASAALASLNLSDHITRQRALNKQARDYATSAIAKLGYAVVPSHTNFFMVQVNRDVKVFRETLRARGVAIGRVFDPLTRHARLSVGTIDEMRKAVGVVSDVLGSA